MWKNVLKIKENITITFEVSQDMFLIFLEFLYSFLFLTNKRLTKQNMTKMLILKLFTKSEFLEEILSTRLKANCGT